MSTTRRKGTLARLLGYTGTPAYLLVAPDSAEVVARVFGAQREPQLRGILDVLIARYGG